MIFAGVLTAAALLNWARRTRGLSRYKEMIAATRLIVSNAS